MYGIPVQADGFVFVVEETVVFIDDGPEGIEVASWGIVEVWFLNAGSKKKEEREKPSHNASRQGGDKAAQIFY